MNNKKAKALRRMSTLNSKKVRVGAEKYYRHAKKIYKDLSVEERKVVK